MIREIIRPWTNQVIINIPQDMVDKELELIVFEIKQDTGAGTHKYWLIERGWDRSVNNLTKVIALHILKS